MKLHNSKYSKLLGLILLALAVGCGGARADKMTTVALLPILESRGEEQAGLRLETYLAKSVYSLGEPIEVQQILRNVSDKSVGITQIAGMANFSLQVEDVTPGRSKLPTQAKKAGGSYSTGTWDMAPGDKTSQWLYADHYFDFSQAGEYMITGCYNLYPDLEGRQRTVKLTCQPLKITVSDKFTPEPLQIEASKLSAKEPTLQLSRKHPQLPLGKNDSVTVKLTTSYKAGLATNPQSNTVVVLDGDDQPVALSKLGTHFSAQGSSQLPAFSLEANQTLTTALKLHQWFDINKTGKYTVVITLVGKQGKNDNLVKIESNKLEFEYVVGMPSQHQLAFH